MRPLIVFVTLLLFLSFGCACWVPDGLTLEEAALAETRIQDYSIEDDPMGCAPGEAAQQLNKFMADWHVDKWGSGCATHWWIGLVAALKLKGRRHTTIADIGCNKAYFTAEALTHLAPEYGNHVNLLYESHQARDTYSNACGNCNECATDGPSEGHTEAQELVEVLCVEPSEIHVTSIALARDKIYGTPDAPEGPQGMSTRVKLHVMHGAVANFTGMARFPRNCHGNNCSLADQAEAFEDVPVTTLDEQTGNTTSPWQYWDIVKIDVEGYDPAVLAGAYRTLLHHKIKALVFEYNGVWTRSGASLAQCVRYMDSLGYACFYDNNVLTRISGTCWDPAYEVKAWSNVVCAVRGTSMEAHLMAGSWLADKVPHVPRPRHKHVRSFYHYIHHSRHTPSQTGAGAAKLF